jgi:L1 cell adhesion molecule like protein
VKDRIEIIPNSQGYRVTPSYVAFNDSERLIGNSAKNQANRNPVNTIFSIKRMIGRPFDDPSVQANREHWPFKLVSIDNRPSVEVSWKQKRELLSPEEISAMILAELKRDAEAFLGCPVMDAVITVPAYFNDSQREATKDAGTIAGLNVLRIINEPTAAALAYGLDVEAAGTDTGSGERNIFVFDWGGGTLDCSILSIDTSGIFQVRAIAGDTYLGGEDLDSVLVDHCRAEFQKKTGLDPRRNQRSMRRLRTACEQAKRQLSTSAVAQVEVDALFEGEDLYLRISQARFESLAAPIFERCMSIVKAAIADANIPLDNIHDVVLVGGSTRIPKIQSLLSAFFQGKPLCKNVNPDEAVAFGAALQAALLSAEDDENADMPDVLLLDVVPLTIGVETIGGLMTPLIKRNTTIPIMKSKMFSTAKDDQDTVTIRVFEGERSQTEHNHLLGVFELSGIQVAPRGVPQIQVTFDVDANGILTVNAKDLKSGNTSDLIIHKDKGQLSSEQIQRMVHDAEQYQKEDELYRATVKARNNLENYLHHLRLVLETDERVVNHITDPERQTIQAMLDNNMELLQQVDENKELYEERLEKAQATVEPIIESINQRLKQPSQK